MNLVSEIISVLALIYLIIELVLLLKNFFKDIKYSFTNKNFTINSRSIIKYITKRKYSFFIMIIIVLFVTYRFDVSFYTLFILGIIFLLLKVVFLILNIIYSKNKTIGKYNSMITRFTFIFLSSLISFMLLTAYLSKTNSENFKTTNSKTIKNKKSIANNKRLERFFKFYFKNDLKGVFSFTGWATPNHAFEQDPIIKLWVRFEVESLTYKENITFDIYPDEKDKFISFLKKKIMRTDIDTIYNSLDSNQNFIFRKHIHTNNTKAYLLSNTKSNEHYLYYENH